MLKERLPYHVNPESKYFTVETWFPTGSTSIIGGDDDLRTAVDALIRSEKPWKRIANRVFTIINAEYDVEATVIADNELGYIVTYLDGSTQRV